MAVASCDKSSGDAKDKNTSVKEPTSNPVKTPPPVVVAGWSTYTADDGSFSILAPAKPRIQKTTTDTEAGTLPITFYMFHKRGSPGAFGVVVSTLPFKDATPAVLETSLKKARDGVLKKYNAKTSHDVSLTINGHPAREFRFEAVHPKMGPMTGFACIVFAGNRLFQANVVRARDATAFGAKGDKFVSSFKILKSK